MASRYYLAAADNALEVLAFHRAENLFQRAAELADSDENRAAVYERMIHYYTDMARFEDAYTTACQATQLFGVRLPSRFIPSLFLLDFVKSKFRLRLRRTAKILDLPSMTDTRLQWVLRIGNACLKAAYQLRPELCVAVSTRLVNLCLASGNTPDCAIGYMVYGAIFQGGVLGFYKIGYEYGLLALSLVEKYKNAAQRAEVNFVVGYFGTSWLQPATEAEELWRTAYQSGLETNDLFHTGCSSAGTIMSYHMRGVPMNTVWEESEKFLGFLKRAQLREPIGCLAVVRQTICNLRGQTESRSSFSDENFDEDAFTKQLVDYGSRHFAHYYFINKMQVLYLWGDYDAAFAVARQSAAYLKDSEGMLHSAEHYLYHGLTMAALAEKNPNQRFKFLAAARKNHARFTRWAASCEHNFRHKECLLSAAISFVAGNTDAALEAYERSIRVAEQYGYVHVKAMAAQQASVLEHRRGNLTKSAEFRKTAVAAWQEWGATAYAEFVASQ
jgi:predicted ATPase